MRLARVTRGGQVCSGLLALSAERYIQAGRSQSAMLGVFTSVQHQREAGGFKWGHACQVVVTDSESL